MKYYGPPILGSGIFGRFPRVKNYLLTRVQYRLLNLFDRLPELSAQWFARNSRRLVGGYLYSLKVELNETCQLHCRMCYVRRGQHALSFELVKSLLDQVRGLGVRIELLGGEPLMYDGLVDVIRHAKKQARVPFISLYTNGLEATAEMARQLKDAGLDAAIVSLISQREEVQDEFTGTSGSWQQTVAGIRNLVSAGVGTYTFTAIHRLNVSDYEAVNRFVREDLKAHALFYQYIPQAAGDPLVIGPALWQQVKHRVLYEHNPGHADFVRKFFMVTGNACSGGNFVLTVKADGSVQPCPFMSDLPLGNIHATDIWTIYRNRYRNTALRELKSLPDECTGCSYRSVCAGGCRAGNRLFSGSYASRDRRCLGPWGEPICKARVSDCVPCFF